MNHANRPIWVTLPSGTELLGGFIYEPKLDGMGKHRTILVGVIAPSFSRFTPVAYLPSGEMIALTPRYCAEHARRDLTFYLAQKQLFTLTAYA